MAHKTEVNGVKLLLHDEHAVRTAYRDIQHTVTSKLGAERFQGVTVQRMISAASGCELILGSSVDAQFGPVLLFGTAGQLVEVFQDRALALPPLNTTLARRFMEQTRVFMALKGIRGRKPVNLEALDHVLVRFSQLVLEQKWIRELDIDPLLVPSEGLVALDARAAVYGAGADPASIPTPAIRPYPSQYVLDSILKDGTALEIRPIRPEGEPEFIRFHGTLSDGSVYRRGEIVGVGRLIKTPGTNRAEVAVVVSDAFQKRGIGTALVQRLIEFARDEKLGLLTASFMRRISRSHGCSKVLALRHVRVRSRRSGKQNYFCNPKSATLK